MSIERKTLPQQHYLYVDRASSLSGEAIAAAMGSGFGEVFGFVEKQGIKPLSMPMAVYMDMPAGGEMRFRTGVFVSEADARHAADGIKAGVMPAGDVFTLTHVGPYASLNQSHKVLWDHMERQGIAKAMPVWEVYVDDPGSTPEASLRTEIYRAVQS